MMPSFVGQWRGDVGRRPSNRHGRSGACSWVNVARSRGSHFVLLLPRCSRVVDRTLVVAGVPILVDAALPFMAQRRRSVGVGQTINRRPCRRKSGLQDPTNELPKHLGGCKHRQPSWSNGFVIESIGPIGDYGVEWHLMTPFQVINRCHIIIKFTKL